MITFREFFIEKFEFDLQSNLAWCRLLEEHEDRLSSYLISSMSHIINVHHVWNSRLLRIPAESNDWDVLPVSYFEKLCLGNYQDTLNFLEQHDLDEKINYHDSEGVPMEKETMNILYHTLNHSTYHRAQIAREARALDLPVANTSFIVFR